MDYYDDQELDVFHEIIARETCVRNCRDNEVRVASTMEPLWYTSDMMKPL